MGSEAALRRPCYVQRQVSSCRASVPGVPDALQNSRTFDPLCPVGRPHVEPECCSGERVGQTCDRVWVPGCCRRSSQRRDGIVWMQQEAVDGGGKRLFGDPALSGGQTRVAAVVRGAQRRIQPVERGEAFVPASGDELLRALGTWTSPQCTKLVLVIRGALWMAMSAPQPFEPCSLALVHLSLLSCSVGFDCGLVAVMDPSSVVAEGERATHPERGRAAPGVACGLRTPGRRPGRAHGFRVRAALRL